MQELGQVLADLDVSLLDSLLPNKLQDIVLVGQIPILQVQQGLEVGETVLEVVQVSKYVS